MGVPIGLAILVALVAGLLVGRAERAVRGPGADRQPDRHAGDEHVRGRHRAVDHRLEHRSAASRTTWSEPVIVWRLLGVPLEFYYALIIALGVWYVLPVHAAGPAAAGRRAGAGGRAAERGPGRCRPLGCARGVRGHRRVRRSALRRNLRRGRARPPDWSCLLPAFAAAFLGATTVNPGRFNAVGHGRRGVLPGHRHHRAAAAGRPVLRAEHLLRRGPGAGRLLLPDRAQATSGARTVSRRPARRRAVDGQGAAHLDRRRADVACGSTTPGRRRSPPSSTGAAG